MSVRNFSRLFQSEIGEPPPHFAERVRAEAARCKLERTSLPVEKIAKDCGFARRLVNSGRLSTATWGDVRLVAPYVPANHTRR